MASRKEGPRDSTPTNNNQSQAEGKQSMSVTEDTRVEKPSDVDEETAMAELIFAQLKQHVTSSQGKLWSAGSITEISNISDGLQGEINEELEQPDQIHENDQVVHDSRDSKHAGEGRASGNQRSSKGESGKGKVTRVSVSNFERPRTAHGSRPSRPASGRANSITFAQAYTLNMAKGGGDPFPSPTSDTRNPVSNVPAGEKDLEGPPRPVRSESAGVLENGSKPRLSTTSRPMSARPGGMARTDSAKSRSSDQQHVSWDVITEKRDLKQIPRAASTRSSISVSAGTSLKEAIPFQKGSSERLSKVDSIAKDRMAKRLSVVTGISQVEAVSVFEELDQFGSRPPSVRGARPHGSAKNRNILESLQKRVSLAVEEEQSIAVASNSKKKGKKAGITKIFPDVDVKPEETSATSANNNLEEPQAISPKINTTQQHPVRFEKCSNSNCVHSERCRHLPTGSILSHLAFTPRFRNTTLGVTNRVQFLEKLAEMGEAGLANSIVTRRSGSRSENKKGSRIGSKQSRGGRRKPTSATDRPESPERVWRTMNDVRRTETALGLSLAGSPSDAGRTLVAGCTYGRLDGRIIRRRPEELNAFESSVSVVKEVEELHLKPVPEGLRHIHQIVFADLNVAKPEESLKTGRRQQKEDSMRKPFEYPKISTRYGANTEWSHKTDSIVQAAPTSHFYMPEEERLIPHRWVDNHHEKRQNYEAKLKNFIKDKNMSVVGQLLQTCV